jgi:hypothetical protein
MDIGVTLPESEEAISSSVESEQYSKLLETATSQGVGHRAFRSLDALSASIRPMKQELH